MKTISVNICVILFLGILCCVPVAKADTHFKIPAPVDAELTDRIVKLEEKGYRFFSDYHFAAPHGSKFRMAIYQMPHPSDLVSGNSYLHPASLVFLQTFTTRFGKTDFIFSKQQLLAGSFGKITDDEVSVFQIFNHILGICLQKYDGTSEGLFRFADIYVTVGEPMLACSFPTKYPIESDSSKNSTYQFEVTIDPIVNPSDGFVDLKLTRKVFGKPSSVIEIKLSQALDNLFQKEDEYIISSEVLLNCLSVPHEEKRCIQRILFPSTGE